MNYNIISFDFDGTISNHHNGDENIYAESVQEKLKFLLSNGFDVHIITRRYDYLHPDKGLGNEHIPVWDMAEKLGVLKEKIHFTNRIWKYNTINNIGSFVHVDDDKTEMMFIEKFFPNVKRILVDSKSWFEPLDYLIDYMSKDK